jgi:GT2 family glycosyltransferase
MQIIVLGMHRAGTSAVTRLINMMGAWLGPHDVLMPASPDNPKGYWERMDVQELNEFLLGKMTANWYLVSNIDIDGVARGVVDEFNGKAIEIINELNNHRPWAMKDPRLCLLFPLWRPLLESPVCVHVSRHPVAVARSLEKRDGIPPHFGMALWERYNHCAIKATQGLPRFNVNYEKLMEEPEKTVRAMYKALCDRGITTLRLPSAQDISIFLESELQHHRIIEQRQASELTQGQIRLWQVLNEPEPRADDDFDNTQSQLSTLAGYEKLFVELGQLRTQIHRLNVGSIESVNKINELESIITAINQEFASREKQLKSDIGKLTRLFETLHHDMQLTFDSMTWKVGYGLAEAGRKIGLLPRMPMVQDHIAQVIKAYQAWRENSLSKFSAAKFNEPLKGYAKPGENVSVDPLEDFDEQDYLSRYPDVRDAVERGEFASGLEHYRRVGHAEIQQGKRPFITASTVLRNQPALIYTDADREQFLKEIKQWQRRPVISVIMPVYNVEVCWLHAAIESVKQQVYPHWQLCIADDCSSRRDIADYLRGLDHPLIKIAFLDRNGGIAEASNAALALADGEYVAFLDHDDELTVDALYQVVKAINERDPDLIYADEDKLTREGYHLEPHFKPDYSPDLLFSINYICHPSVYRKARLEKIGGFRAGFDGAQDYDLLLRFLDHTDRVHHIPKILYHWRKIPGSTAAQFSHKNYAWEAGRKAIAETLERRGISGSVILGNSPGNYRVRRTLLAQPKISIVIPFRDQPALLRECIDSILSKTTYEHFEIVGVSNNSCERETFALMEDYGNRDPRIRFLIHDIPFNFSAINNFAVRQVDGEQVVLLNNDITIITPDWLEALLEHAQRPEVGAVGAKLYYPDDTVQHGGVIIGIGGIAGHAHKYCQRDDSGYFDRLHLIQNLSAVTAACLMVKKSVYEQIDGMDEQHLSIAFNDVDFCLRLREKGYLNIFTPYCELYHHESKSRGYEDTPQKQQRFAREVAYMRKRHAAILASGDPYYNPNLPLDREDFGIP